jgi:hypothetical protein
MSIPIGSIIAFYGIGQSIPSGFRACDGTLFTSSEHPALFNLLVRSGNPLLRKQNPWDPQDPRTLPANTIRVPDLRGEFLRGYWTQVPSSEPAKPFNDSSDPLRNLGSYQADNFRAHAHQIPYTVQVYDGGSRGFRHTPGGGPDTNVSNIGVTVSGGPETRPNNVAITFIICANANPALNPTLYQASPAELGLSTEREIKEFIEQHPDFELV